MKEIQLTQYFDGIAPACSDGRSRPLPDAVGGQYHSLLDCAINSKSNIYLT